MKTFQLPANSNYGDRPIPVGELAGTPILAF